MIFLRGLKTKKPILIRVGFFTYQCFPINFIRILSIFDSDGSPKKSKNY
jgi:hypothetical protein